MCRSVIENASGRSKSVLASVGTSVKTLLKAPHRFFFSKPFALIYVSFQLRLGDRTSAVDHRAASPKMTYCGTYLSANSIDTMSSVRDGTKLAAVTAGTEKFATTSV